MGGVAKFGRINLGLPGSSVLTAQLNLETIRLDLKKGVKFYFWPSPRFRRTKSLLGAIEC
jgi:hypothetical protein